MTENGKDLILNYRRLTIATYRKWHDSHTCSPNYVLVVIPKMNHYFLCNQFALPSAMHLMETSPLTKRVLVTRLSSPNECFLSRRTNRQSIKAMNTRFDDEPFFAPPTPLRFRTKARHASRTHRPKVATAATNTRHLFPQPALPNQQPPQKPNRYRKLPARETSPIRQGGRVHISSPNRRIV